MIDAMRAVTLAIAALLLSASGAGVNAATGETDLLVIESDRSGVSQLYLVSPDGRAIERLGRPRGYTSLVNVSPDGRRIVYYDGARQTEYMVGSDGRGERRLPGEFIDDENGSWAPDSSALVYEEDAGTLLVVDRAGSPRRRLSNGVVASWEPGGRRLAFVTYYPRARIERLVDGGRRSFLGSVGFEAFGPAWSPDAKLVAFASSRPGAAADLVVAAADGSGAVQVTRTSAHETQPAWSPDGEWLAFVRFVGEDEAQIWLMRRRGGESRRLTEGALDLNPAWSPDGRWLLFDRGDDPDDDERELMRVAPDGRGLRRLAPGVAASEPSWFPNGSGFVATVARGERTALGRFGASGRLLHLLTPPGEYSEAVISPDGHSIAHVRDGHIAIMPAAGGAARLVTRGDEAESGPAWGPNGLTFSVDPPNADLDIVSIAGGRRVPLAHDVGSDAALEWSPRGDEIAYTTDDGVRVRLLDGTTIRTLRRADTYALEWSVDGSWLAVDDLEGVTFVGRNGTIRRIGGTETLWSWVPGGKDVLLERGRRVTQLTLATGVSRARPGLRGIADGDPWSVTGRRVALERRRAPGLGHDVYLVGRQGRITRVTRPFPDGGTNRFAAWARGPRPTAVPPAPAVVAVKPVPLARPAGVERLALAGDHVTWVGGNPSTECAPAHVIRGVESDRIVYPCRGGSPLLSVAATRDRAAWVLFHSDDGIGDEDGACLYVRRAGERISARELRHPCDPDDPGREPVATSFGGVLGPVLAVAGNVIAQGAGWIDGAIRNSLFRVDGRRISSLVETRAPLALLDVDASRVVARVGLGPVVVYGWDRGVLRTLDFPRGTVLDAAVDGSRLVVLRPRAIEQYDLSSRRRLARLPVRRGLGPEPKLDGSAAGVAAYHVGAVVHVVRFRDGRDVPLWVRGTASPVHAALTRDGLYTGLNLERPRPAGLVGLVPFDRLPFPAPRP